MATESPKRLSITISEYDYLRLKEWAGLHGKTPTAYAGQIVTSGIEANVELVEMLKADAARREGCSVEDLEKRWHDTESTDYD